MTDFLSQLGNLALASRLRRLAERLYRDGERVYAAGGLDFEPRWFQVVARLREAGARPLPITVVAKDLGITHPAVIKVVREMEQRGVVVSDSDPADARKRRVRLTAGGRRLVARLAPLWAAFEDATHELLGEIDCDLTAVLDRLEAALANRDMAQRVLSRLEGLAPGVEIVRHRPGLAWQFRRLNAEWLEEDFRIEPYDRKQLDQPKKEIIDRGGEILYARLGHRVVGTVALIRLSAKRMELAKMAVERGERGQGIGGALLRAAIDRARQRGAASLVLRTHPKHRAATYLYRKHGFVEKAVRIPSARSVERAAGGFGMALDLRKGTEGREAGGKS